MGQQPISFGGETKEMMLWKEFEWKKIPLLSSDWVFDPGLVFIRQFSFRANFCLQKEKNVKCVEIGTIVHSGGKFPLLFLLHSISIYPLSNSNCAESDSFTISHIPLQIVYSLSGTFCINIHPNCIFSFRTFKRSKLTKLRRCWFWGNLGSLLKVLSHGCPIFNWCRRVLKKRAVLLPPKKVWSPKAIYLYLSQLLLW